LFWIWTYESFTNCLAVALFCSKAGQEDWFFKARFTAAKWLSNCEIGSKEALISEGDLGWWIQVLLLEDQHPWLDLNVPLQQGEDLF
jgi:hypothetical protein